MAGFNPDLELTHQEETDWIFGSSSQKCRALMQEAVRAGFLPAGEVQRGRDDFMDCATRSPVNELETKFNYLDQNGLLTDGELAFIKQYRNKKTGRIEFSDRFIAVKSGTTRAGNSLKAPVDAIHRVGLIPKSILPANRSMTFEEYHDPKAITPAMDALGLQFLKYFPINYERVFLDDFPQIIKEDMVGIAGYAWPTPDENGVYWRTDKMFNHAFLYFAEPAYRIFDNYTEEYDGDFIKQLAPDYRLMDYGYRVYISKSSQELTQPLVSQKVLSQILSLLRQGRPNEVLDLIRRKTAQFWGL